jgi:hypothetical protein
MTYIKPSSKILQINDVNIQRKCDITLSLKGYDTQGLPIEGLDVEIIARDGNRQNSSMPITLEITQRNAARVRKDK